MPLLIINLIKEKEKRIKEAMFMMGLRPTVYWFVWFVIEAFIVLIVSAVMATFCTYTQFLYQSNNWIFFCLVFMVGLTFIEFSAIFSMFFDKELVRIVIRFHLLYNYLF